MSKTNLDASIEATEEKNRDLFREIVDPTPGLVVDDLFTNADLNRAQNENETKFKLNENVKKTLNSIFRDLDDVLQKAKSESTISFPQISTDNRKDFIVDPEDKDIDISKTALQTKITTSKKFLPKKRSPYFLRKRKTAFLESADTLSNKPLIKKSIPDQEFDKIKATESIADSIVKQLPDQQKKLKFDLDESNDFKISEL